MFLFIWCLMKQVLELEAHVIVRLRSWQIDWVWYFILDMSKLRLRGAAVVVPDKARIVFIFDIDGEHISLEIEFVFFSNEKHNFYSLLFMW